MVKVGQIQFCICIFASTILLFSIFGGSWICKGTVNIGLWKNKCKMQGSFHSQETSIACIHYDTSLFKVVQIFMVLALISSGLSILFTILAMTASDTVKPFISAIFCIIAITTISIALIYFGSNVPMQLISWSFYLAMVAAFVHLGITVTAFFFKNYNCKMMLCEEDNIVIENETSPVYTITA